MKRRKILLLLSAILASVATLSAQWEYPFEYVEPLSAAEALSDGANTSRDMLLPHRATTPYPTREAFVSGAPSEMVIELGGWQVESLDGHRTRYTTRFKRNYRYDDRELVLRIEGADGAVSVEVNDTEVGFSASAAGRTEFDLTKSLRENNTTISITVHGYYAARAI